MRMQVVMKVRAQTSHLSFLSHSVLCAKVASDDQGEERRLTGISLT